jgi:serine protease Do
MTVANISAETARRFQLERNQKGVIVTDIDPGSPAELAGIQAGDVIEEVNRQPVESVEDFNKAMSAAKDNETLLLLARRGTATSFFALRK